MKNIIYIFCVIVIANFSCKKEETQCEQLPVTIDNTLYNLDFGDFSPPLVLDSVNLTNSKIELGRMLFYETMLSTDNNQSCASCHSQATSFSDTAQFSIGSLGDIGGRQAMSIVNLAWNPNGFFWDGRSPTLAHQSLQPIINPEEMAETHENVISKLNMEQDYKNQFIRAFGNDEITADKMGKAMEQFMITIISNQSKYDLYLSGQAQLTISEERGRELFFAEYNPFFPEDSGADCAHCHAGFNFTNDLFMNNGLDQDADFTDLGRYQITEQNSDKAKFRTTTLRNIELTPPYMHDGRFQNLEEVVNHYNSELNSSSTIDPALDATMATGLMLTEQDKIDLVNFLKTLTDMDLINNPDFESPF